MTAWGVPLLECHLSHRLQVAYELVYLLLLATVVLPWVGVAWQDDERTLLQG